MHKKGLAALDRLEAHLERVIEEKKRYAIALGRVDTDLIFGDTLRPETIKFVKETMRAAPTDKGGA